jgi:hypothetical protein
MKECAMTQKSRRKAALSLVVLVMLAACGGGGGGGATGPGGGGGGGGGGDTNSKSWQAPELMHTQQSGNIMYNHQIAFDARGNALAIWQQNEDNGVHTWANRYSTSNDRWDVGAKIASSTRGHSFAYGRNGDALAAWTTNGGDLWVRAYTASTNSWGVSQKIWGDGRGFGGTTKVLIDSNGNALVIWSHSDTVQSETNLRAIYYTATTDSWGAAELIESGTGDVRESDVAMDASGNAVATWSQEESDTANLWSSRFSASSKRWGPAELLETDNRGSTRASRIAFDATGNALVVWEQYAGAVANLMTNRYSAFGGSWGTASLIASRTEGRLEPQIADDATGNIMAVWRGGGNIYASRYAASGTGWSTPTLVEISDGFSYEPQIALETNGDALAVWYRTEGTQINIWANRYTVSTGSWGVAVQLNGPELGISLEPKIAIGTDGKALALWKRIDDPDGTRTQQLWASRYQ